MEVYKKKWGKTQFITAVNGCVCFSDIERGDGNLG